MVCCGAFWSENFHSGKYHATIVPEIIHSLALNLGYCVSRFLVGLCHYHQVIFDWFRQLLRSWKICYNFQVCNTRINIEVMSGAFTNPRILLPSHLLLTFESLPNFCSPRVPLESPSWSILYFIRWEFWHGIEAEKIPPFAIWPNETTEIVRACWLDKTFWLVIPKNPFSITIRVVNVKKRESKCWSMHQKPYFIFTNLWPSRDFHLPELWEFIFGYLM